ncbi:hypothetical protein [Streptomyces sp. NPDC058867]|uniref:hypothetical protein n=1 Tax=unclassified Streptomyces TaxID=2593676 RepID=UPI003697EC4F
MNTERPDNGDAAEPDGVEPTGTPRDADDTVGPAGNAQPPGEDGADIPGPHEGDGDGADSGPPRRRSPAIIASVAAAVLLVGGGGAYLAATASDGSDGANGDTSSGARGTGTPPPLALDGYSEGSGGSDGSDGGIAPGEPNPYGATYEADGALPEGPESAAVYRSSGTVTEDEVTRLAEALGVTGKPVLQGQSWRIGAKDGYGPVLQVNRQAPGTWTFQRYAQGPDACESDTVCTQKPGGPGVDPVGEAAAKKAAAPVLKAVGQDGAKLDAGQVMGSQRVVNADPVVGGLPTYGWTTGVSVGAQGEVVGGSGQLKAPVKGDTYPVLAAEDTLKLMNSTPGAAPGAGIGGCASPVPLEDGSEVTCEADATSTPKQDVIEVEKAVFGLAAHQVDGRQALVPSWLFQVRAPGAGDAFTVTHPAVEPEFLTSAAPSAGPSDPSSPKPSEPGSDPSTRDVTVEGYTAEGRELTVSFLGGVCADYEVDVTESGDEVTVTVTETPWPDKVCIMIAKTYHRTVPLDEPLGDRKVVGADGGPVPLEKSGARLPDTSTAR